jgi:hypothetical protein
MTRRIDGQIVDAAIALVRAWTDRAGAEAERAALVAAVMAYIEAKSPKGNNGRPPIDADKIAILNDAFWSGVSSTDAAVRAKVGRNTAINYYARFRAEAQTTRG